MMLPQLQVQQIEESLSTEVMLDHKLKPWMLEVNHMPSFKADT